MRRLTTVSTSLYALSLFAGRESFAWAVSCCLAWSVMVAFHLAYVADPSSFERMRARNGWSFAAFHAGNLVLHVLPALHSLTRLPCTLRAHHALLSSLAALAWGALATRGKMVLDEAYVPLPPKKWACLWIGAAAAPLPLLLVPSCPSAR